VNDIVVEHRRWAPVSAGEYDRRRRTVVVNLAVVEAVHARYGHDPALVIAAIVAHERVHVVATADALPHEEERIARAAAIDVAGAEVVAHVDEVLAGAWT
jgi:hypothetical protein